MNKPMIHIHRLLIKSVACAVLAAFTYSFVLFEPLYGATTLLKERAKAAAITDTLSQFVLPSRYGTIMGGEYAGGPRLVIYIQDLHCHPEVQRNISDIIALFDKRYGVSRILLEGAPQGKLNSGVLSSLSDEKSRKQVLDALLAKGLIGGPEHYAGTARQDKLYGLEEWRVYRDNLARIQRLLQDKEKNKTAAVRLHELLEEVKQNSLSRELRKLERHFKSKDSSQSAVTKRYRRMKHLGRETGEELKDYPDLERYIRLQELSAGINYKRLYSELRSFVAELRSAVPYGVYRALARKLERGNAEEEYYLSLREIARTYWPLYYQRFPNVKQFLEYVETRHTINPVLLVSEERAFVNRVLGKSAQRLKDKELLMVSRMSELLTNY